MNNNKRWKWIKKIKRAKNNKKWEGARIRNKKKPIFLVKSQRLIKVKGHVSVVSLVKK